MDTAGDDSKMKMKMNKNKTMLALIVVAALALCSVAVVATESDDSSAATSTNTGTVTINEQTAGIDYDLYYSATGVVATDCKVIISSEFTYTGTIQFGTYVASTNTFTPTATLVLTDVSNLEIDCNTAGVVTMYTLDQDTHGVGVTSGDVEITKGSVIIGTSAANYFAGFISGNTAEIISVNTYGAVLTAGTTDSISGIIAKGTEYVWDSSLATPAYVVADAELAIDGTATVIDTVGDLVISANVEVIVSDSASITVGSAGQTYSITSGTTFTVKVGSATGTQSIQGYVYTSSGTLVATSSSITAGVATFTTSAAMNMEDSYRIVMILNESSTLKYYDGTLTFGVSGTSTFTLKTYFSSVSAASVATISATSGVPTDKMIAGIMSSATTVSYNSTDYTFVSAAFLNASGVAVWGTASSSTITFSTAIVADGSALIIVKNNTTGLLYAYYGTITLSTLGLGVPNVAPTLSVGTVVAIGTIVSGATSTAAGLVADNDTATITNAGKLTVDGTIAVTYSTATACGIILNTGIVNANGKITYVYTSTAAPISGTVNGAYYYTTSTSTSLTTFTYTSIGTAVTEGSTIVIVGTNVLEEDTTLTGTGTTNTITVDSGAIVKVGVAATTTESEISAILTLPTTTTLILNGTINVQSGEFIVEGTTAPTYSTTQVVADVLMAGTSEYIYTDLATALDISTSGQTVTVRATAPISFTSDVELKSGVTLNMNSVALTVGSGVTFTVNGILKAGAVTVNAATSTKSAGSLVLNNYSTTMTLGAFTLAGSLTFGSGFDNTATTASAFPEITVTGTSTAPSTITVAGKVVFGSAMVAALNNNVVVTVTGTVTSNVAIFSDADLTSKLIVNGGTYTAKATDDINTIVVTGNGIVTTSVSTYVITTDKITVGTAVTTLVANTNGATVFVTLNNGGTATVYGSFDDEKIIISTASVGKNFSTAYYLTDSIIYATFYENDATATPVASMYIYNAIADPEITGKLFNSWYTNATLNKEVSIIDAIGSYSKVYAGFTTQTISITLTYVQNGYWMVNGNVYAGNTVSIDWASSYSISFIADDGYELKDYAVYVNGSAMPLGYTPTAGDVLTFNGTVEAKAISEDTSMEITTILLIIITIVIIIMAIVIVLRLMRS